jgi:hypothetical protein
MTDDADQADQAEGTDQFWKLLHEHPDVPSREES